MRRHIENYFLDVITGKQKGILAFLLKLLLWVLSWPYKAYVMGRNWAFDKGWLCRYYPPVPVVISIGNIVVGGTGKTPVTLLIAQEFYDEFPLAVLSRGYRSQAEKLAVPVVLSKGEGPLQSAAFCGDEPFLIAQNLPKAFVIVGKNRHKASDMAARAGAQLVLLDDGMQHRGLARDFDVVVMDTSDPFGQGYFLPRGLLREGASSLKRAGLIILNHAADTNKFLEMKEQLARYSKALVVGTQMEVVQIEHFDGKPVETLQNRKVGIFCGIAHPEYFERTVLQQGAQIVASAFAADHKCLEPEAFGAFARHCKENGAEMLLCTEKDKVKIENARDIVLPIAWVKMRLALVQGHGEWRTFIERVKSDLKRSGLGNL